MATLHWADYLVFSLFLLISLLIGAYFALSGGKQKLVGEFITLIGVFHHSSLISIINLSGINPRFLSYTY